MFCDLKNVQFWVKCPACHCHYFLHCDWMAETNTTQSNHHSLHVQVLNKDCTTLEELIGLLLVFEYLCLYQMKFTDNIKMKNNA